MQLNGVVVVDLGPVLRQQIPDGSHGAAAHGLWGTASHGDGCDGGQGLDAQLGGLLAGHQQQRRSPIVHARGVAGRDGTALGDERGGQPRKGLHGQVCPEMLVLVNDDLLLLLLCGNGHDLVVESTALRGSFSTAVAPQCQLVLLFTGDAILAGHKLGGQAHDVRFATELLLGAVQRIRDEVGAHVQSADEGVDALTILQPSAPAGAGQEVRLHAHVLHSPRQNHVVNAGADGHGCVLHARHPRGAHAVDCDGRHCLRDAGQKGPNACNVQGADVRETGTKADVTNDATIHVCPFDRFLHDVLSKNRSRDIF
mmetsp:Transcript_7599/g.14522  ORF Transcript_7599/g.14522 Transcript_7599/m.14522 type:complete len:312 (-) Transcript_7599:110-1045(-)